MLAESRAGARLDALRANQLLKESRPGRYEFHDLVRVYATNLAHDIDPADAGSFVAGGREATAVCQAE